MQPILHQPPKKEYRGEFIGLVESVDDPKKLMRVQVRVQPLFPKEIPIKHLPWAEYKLPVGARPNDGFFTPVKVGDYVWVDFPYGGDTRRPRITGSVHFCPGGNPNLPHEAWTGPESIEHKKVGKQPDSTPPGYHDGSILINQNGFCIELRNDESLCITHRSTGTEIEITPDGKLTVHCEADINISSLSDTNIVVMGNTNLDCAGKTTVISAGTVEIDGGSGEVKGVVQGDCLCCVTGKPHQMISSNVKASQ